MSIEAVREYFRKFNMEDRIIELAESSATVELAAAALGCEPERIAKTLSFHMNDGVVLIVAAGDVRVDNKAEDLIGHTVGGICPFGVKEGVKIYLDNSLRRFKTVYPAAGSSNSAIELTLDELYIYSNCIEWVDVSKEKENAGG